MLYDFLHFLSEPTSLGLVSSNYTYLKILLILKDISCKLEQDDGYYFSALVIRRDKLWPMPLYRVDQKFRHIKTSFTYTSKKM